MGMSCLAGAAVSPAKPATYFRTAPESRQRALCCPAGGISIVVGWDQSYGAGLQRGCRLPVAHGRKRARIKGAVLPTSCTRSGPGLGCLGEVAPSCTTVLPLQPRL